NAHLQNVAHPRLRSIDGSAVRTEGKPPSRTGDLEVRCQRRGFRGAPASAIELSTLFNGERDVVDVAFNLGGRLEGDCNCANNTGDPGAHDHALGGNGAGHPALLTDDDFRTPDVALDFTVNLQRSLADDSETRANDLEIVADHRLGPWLGRTLVRG